MARYVEEKIKRRKEIGAKRRGQRHNNPSPHPTTSNESGSDTGNNNS
jgi:hypothetical protein